MKLIPKKSNTKIKPKESTSNTAKKETKKKASKEGNKENLTALRIYKTKVSLKYCRIYKIQSHQYKLI